MFYSDKVERARAYQLEKKASEEVEYDGEKLYEPTIEDVMEKGDMPALMISAVMTILPTAAAALLVIVLIAGLMFHIFW